LLFFEKKAQKTTLCTTTAVQGVVLFLEWQFYLHSVRPSRRVLSHQFRKLFDLLAAIVAAVCYDNNRGRVDAEPFQLSKKHANTFSTLISVGKVHKYFSVMTESNEICVGQR
jgi:hypothetical protein